MYVVTPHLNRLFETVQMRGHNIWFHLEIRKIIPNNHHILSYLELWLCVCIKYRDTDYDIFVQVHIHCMQYKAFLGKILKI